MRESDKSDKVVQIIGPVVDVEFSEIIYRLFIRLCGSPAKVLTCENDRCCCRSAAAFGRRTRSRGFDAADRRYGSRDEGHRPWRADQGAGRRGDTGTRDERHRRSGRRARTGQSPKRNRRSTATHRRLTSRRPRSKCSKRASRSST